MNCKLKLHSKGFYQQILGAVTVLKFLQKLALAQGNNGVGRDMYWVLALVRLYENFLAKLLYWHWDTEKKENKQRYKI